ncbi:hypothetical protein BO71DRAFT_403940 [Aspergillus ellipticus CBS 707.79]|uniref:Uncharacterized protein n=1 Tax=Aspergillus ellipticus CBS 707.79 TaxID=1448320 RepID=A0A319CSM8_9EURO|nr:hypothetical protein BO71DRAFT_403940 [Aspergillus ellipticus CBS 707.79]
MLGRNHPWHQHRPSFYDVTASPSRSSPVQSSAYLIGQGYSVLRDPRSGGKLNSCLQQGMWTVEAIILRGQLALPAQADLAARSDRSCRTEYTSLVYPPRIMIIPPSRHPDSRHLMEGEGARDTTPGSPAPSDDGPRNYSIRGPEYGVRRCHGLMTNGQPPGMLGRKRGRAFLWCTGFGGAQPSWAGGIPGS